MTKLRVEDIYNKANLSHLNIKSSEDITPLDGEIMKQERAKQAIKFGLAVKGFGYNIFVSGGSSTKKRSYLQSALLESAKKKNIPNDLVFIHNFEEETEPLLISMPAGKGELFEKEMAELNTFLKTNLKEHFESTDYKKNEELFFQEYDLKYSELIETYSEKLEEYHYTFANSSEGHLVPSPITKEGELFTQEQYDELSDEETEVYSDNKKLIDIIMIEYIHKQNKINQEKEAEKEEIDKKIVEGLISSRINELKKQFSQYSEEISPYLDHIKKDVLENISSYKKEEKKQPQNVIQILSGAPSESKTSENPKYTVNLFVNNKDLEHAPVVFVEEFDPNTFFGAIEFNIEGQSVSTGFKKITAGDIIKANGGYIVLKVEDLFKHQNVWDKFKTTIKNQEVKLHTRLYRDMVISNTLKPSPIPINVKVILVGDYNWYSSLHTNDPEFEELFKIHALFEENTVRDSDTELEYVRFLKKYIDENELKPFNLEALETVLEYSSRLADHQKRLVLNFNGIYKVLDEADAWAEIEGKEVVDKETVEKALSEKDFRSGFIKEYYDNALEEKVYLIQTSGERVGSVNALYVADYGDFRIGRPSLLTANTYRGTEGVISIDRNAKMSGRLHDKAIETVKGFIGKTFGQKHPLSIVANVAFEQNYGGIDGDSATTTTLYAILSDLSGIPIKQHFAVTGSMNQKGDVQVVGGVNEKVEGFFQSCKIQGLTGEQGVLIPEGNVKDLMLSSEIREAVKNNQFHIHSVSHVHQGIEILTGLSFEDVFTKIEFNLNQNRVRDKVNSK